jgi:hypothetical protein
LDDLLTGVEAFQASANENDAILSKIDIEPIAPIAAPGEDVAQPNTGKRVRE